MVLPPQADTLFNAFTDVGIPSICPEVDAARILAPALIAPFVEGTLNVLRHCGVVGGSIGRADADPNVFIGNAALPIVATEGGFIAHLFKLNDKVAAGQNAVVQRNTFGEAVADYPSPIDGEVGAMLSHELRDPQFEGANIFVVTSLGHALRVLRRSCGDAWCLAQVRLSMTKAKDTARYEALFGAPARFDSPMDALVFPPRGLDQPVVPTALHAGSQLPPQAAWDFAVHVRQQIAIRVGIKPVDAQVIAEDLGMSGRALDRRLAGCGVSFRKLLDQMRFARARRLLMAGHMPLAEIDLALGCADPSAFSRAFRKGADVSPQTWRDRNLQLNRPLG